MVNSVKFNLPTEIPVTKQGKVVMINILHLLSLSCHHHLHLFRIIGLDQVLDLSLLFFTLNIKYHTFLRIMFLCLFVCCCFCK